MKNNFLWLLPLLTLWSCVQFLPDSIVKWQPSYGGSENILLVQRQNYILGYHEPSEQAAWVLYELLASEVSGRRVARTNNFRADSLVLIPTGSASLSDYRRSGYDRGHLAPAADMSFSPEAMSESFFLSNMSPQRPSFNRGVWKNLEALTRTWAKRHKRLIIVTAGVVTGPQAKNDLPRIGTNKVLVPRHYYKIIYDPQRQTMIAFLLENKGYRFKSGENLSLFAVSVDRVEKLTGLDFFSQLADLTEEELESQKDLGRWDFRPTR